METFLDRAAIHFWRRLNVGCNWAAVLANGASSFCLHREVHIIVECGSSPGSHSILAPDPERVSACAARTCPDGRHCIHYYTDHPATCCDCKERLD